LGENHRPEPPDNREVPGSDPSMDLIEEKGAIVVNGAGITAQVDAQTGKFRSLNFQNRLLLSGGPELMLLPLNPAGPPQLTADSWVFQPYTDPCSLWKAESVSPEWSPQGGAIRVTGSYREASGEYTIFFKNSGILEISYRFFVRNPIDPRQIGMVLSTPLDLDTLTWRRRGLWSTYPDLHIGRLSGRAVPFPVQEISGPVGPIRIPGGPWAHDGTELGSNDFRSTKTLIHWAALQDRAGTGLVIHSDGSQHIRCWVEGEAVKILIAQHSNAGAERFFRPHAQPGYRSLESGEVISGVVRMSFVGR